MDIAAWLRELGLERYEPVFRDNEIDAEVLPRLTAEDLTALGVTAVGHRRKLLDAVAALRMGNDTLATGPPELAAETPVGTARGLRIKPFAKPAPGRTVGAVWRKSGV